MIASNWASRFPWELGEIRAPPLHVRVLPFLCLFRAVEYQRGITAKLLQHKIDQRLQTRRQKHPAEYNSQLTPELGYVLSSRNYSGKGIVSKIIPEDLHGRHLLRWVQISELEWPWGCSLRFAGTISRFLAPIQQAKCARHILPVHQQECNIILA